MIIQALQDLQARHGYLPRRALHQLADRLAVPLYRIQEVASFYPHFTLFPDQAIEDREKLKLPKHEVAICRDMACRLRGSTQVTSALAMLPCVQNGSVAVHEVSCLGRCDRAPAVRMHTHDNDHTVRNFHGLPAEEIAGYVSRVADDKADKSEIPDLRDELLPQPSDKWQINIYAGVPVEQRYLAIKLWLDKLLNPPAAPPATSEKPKPARGEQKPDHPLIAALWTANLLGMGGAGGRAWKKWDEVLRASGETKYVVCNGDESEPGTFKDRELLLRTPYLVIEGVILAGLLLRAKKGYLYIRHEYEEQIAALNAELKEARRLGVCGENILGSGLSFDVEVFVSPGGYICGEQTALIQAIQDERAEPRNRPPELQTNGLWDCPTLLSNVETFAWVPAILTQGAQDGAWYSTLGQARTNPAGGLAHYQGARFFSVSGDVAQPGVYEVPVGITLGQLINEHSGGMRKGLKLKAVATSGPSAGFLPAAIPLDSFSGGVQKKLRDMGLVVEGEKEFQLVKLPLELATVRELNIMVGAGLVVYAEGADLVDQAVAASRFYQAESCGKCVPCRIGSTKLVEIGEDLQAGALPAAEVAELLANPGGKVTELAQVMAETAICGLGNVAPNPLRTLLSYFPKDIDSSRVRQNAG